ncbi:hypothetical protein PhaeoP57_02093 [Phaeobacter inhibens]|nr:hypothetical protein PhaeoP57_02093 [Phaeobacter inhibens]
MVQFHPCIAQRQRQCGAVRVRQMQTAQGTALLDQRGGGMGAVPLHQGREHIVKGQDAILRHRHLPAEIAPLQIDNLARALRGCRQRGCEIGAAADPVGDPCRAAAAVQIEPARAALRCGGWVDGNGLEIEAIGKPKKPVVGAKDRMAAARLHRHAEAFLHMGDRRVQRICGHSKMIQLHDVSPLPALPLRQRETSRTSPGRKRQYWRHVRGQTAPLPPVVDRVSDAAAPKAAKGAFAQGQTRLRGREHYGCRNAGADRCAQRDPTRTIGT